MKKTISILLTFFVLSNIVTAQSADETKITANITAFNKGLVDADKATLESLVFDGLSYGHSTGTIENKSQFITAVISGPVDYLSVDITDQTIQVTGNTAIVRHKFFAKLMRDGKPDEVKIGVLQIWQKQKSKWTLLARQAYKL